MKSKSEKPNEILFKRGLMINYIIIVIEISRSPMIGSLQENIYDESP